MGLSAEPVTRDVRLVAERPVGYESWSMPVIDERSIPRVALAPLNEDHTEEARLLNVAADILDSYAQGKAEAPAVISALDALYAWTRTHFEREQAAMRVASFPAHVVHQNEHERVLALIDAEERRFRETRDVGALREFLAVNHPAWLEEHITTMDAAAARFGLSWGQ